MSAADDGNVGKDALAWLAERGVTREPLRVEPRDEPAAPSAPAPRAREVVNLAATPPPTPLAPLAPPSGVAVGVPPPDGEQPPEPGPLSDEVSTALDFVRRSTANSVQSRGRLAEKLAERDVPSVVAEQALDRAEAEGLVDDLLVLPALVDERRAQGHAPRRIRDDLRQRGFRGEDVDAALRDVLEEDPHAAAFGLARDRAATMTGVAPETAHRRITAWLARRGYPEAVASKAARDAVWTDREVQRTAGR